MPIAPLTPDHLTVAYEAGRLGFETTDDLQAGESGLGQARAMEAITFGAEIGVPGYNLFLMGPEGTGKQAAILDYLRARAAGEPTPPDWVYVNDFAQRHRPNAIPLPPGRAVQLAEAMQRFVEDIREAIPALFDNEENQSRLHAISEAFQQKPEEAFEALRERAAQRNIALIRTPMGFGFAPMADGEVIKPEAYEKLGQAERERIEADIQALQKELQDVIKQLPRWESERRRAIRELQAEITAIGISASMEAVLEAFKDLPEVLEYLEAVRQDLIENFHAIRGAEQMATQDQRPDGLGAALEIGGFERYKVNPLISHGDGNGAPVVIEDNPTALNLIGRAEHVARFGALMTDFSLIKAGALHRANGGYLILDARKLLLQPFSWEALKRALKARKIVVEAPGQAYSLIATVSLEPEPIPLTTKVVLIGERLLFYLLSEMDPEFPDLFKVVADFETEIDRADHSEDAFACMIAGQVRAAALRPFESGAVAEVMRRSMRLAGDRKKLSIRMRGLSDLLDEADYMAGREKAARVTADHVRRAIDAQIRRLDRMREKDLELIGRDIVLIETDGVALGQVNGLSVLQLGGFAFGRPSRITARVRLGAGKVIDIEREVKLGGPLHSKGVLILSGFLAGRYAVDAPLSLSATLVFEQSYGGVDGDSASSAELYALLSALAGVPLRQDLAVTGSVNQFGQVQAIGGVNEKIEGFFDVCKTRGLTGAQGVLIPAANVAHLMLRDDVVAAAADGRFHIYPVETIDDGIALLTGQPAGERDGDGRFPDGSINARVEARLRDFASARQAFAGGEPDAKDDTA